jgi:tetratricopeptide (TPR) repeat protein
MRLILLAPLAFAYSFAGDCPSSALAPQELQARFQELDRKAQVEFRHGEFAKASEDFHQATCAAPQNMRPYYALYEIATGAVATGDFSRARQTLQEADRLRPDYPLPLAMLVKVNLTSSDINGLKRCLLDAARRFPRNFKLHAELAQDLLREKQHDLALAEALRADDGAASNAKARLNLAVLENQAGAFGDAIRLASLVEEQTGLPETIKASAASIAGLSFESSGQLQEAIQRFKVAIRLDPAQAQPYLALSRIYAAMEDRSASAQILEDAREQAGSSPNILLALGSALVSTEQYQAASQVLAGLIQDFPDQFEAYPKLAEAYRNMGEPTRATEALRQLSLRKPDDSMLHVVIAQSLLDEEKVDYSQVLHELEQAAKAAPGDYDIHYLRAKAFMATARYKQAIDSLRRAIELRPTEPGAYYQLGLAYRKVGEPDLAKQQFEKLDFLKSTHDPLKARD